MTKRTIGATLGDMRRRAGLSLSAVARRAGYSGPSSVQVFFNPDYDPPSLDLAIAHKLSLALEGQGTPPITPEEIFLLTRVGYDRLPNKRVMINMEPDLGSGITVYETRHGGFKIISSKTHQKALEFFQVNLERATETFPPQPGLPALRGAFAIRIAGDAMSPKYRDGDPVFIDVRRAAARGDDVVVILAEAKSPDFSDGIAGLLVSRGEENILVRQHKGGRSARIPTQGISKILRVIPWSEVCGISYA